MGDYARRRHLPPGAEWKTLFIEQFEGTTSRNIPKWRIIGKPIITPIRLGGENGVELTAPEGTFETCGIERDINPKLLAGRDVYLILRFTCRSERRFNALTGLALSLQTSDHSGYTHTLPLPIVAGVTTGWEIQAYRLRFLPNLKAIKLSIHLNQPGTIFTLDKISFTGKETLTERKHTPSGTTSTKPVNLIAGGDFETGQQSFFTSATNYWPNSQEMPLPLRWKFDSEAAVGQNSILLNIVDETGRLAFGPLDLTTLTSVPSQSLPGHLSFHARTDRPTTVVVTLRNRHKTLDRSTFQLSTKWQRFQKTFTISAPTYDEQVQLKSTELLFDVLTDGTPEVNRCRIDAVALTDLPIDELYLRHAPVEVGLFGPTQDPTDLANLVDQKNPVSFSIKLVTDPKMTPSTAPAEAASQPNHHTSKVKIGKLAVDLLDAWDRVVWTKTITPAIPETGILKDTVKLKLPRGYYRALATLWTSDPGESDIISHAHLPMAVISMHDPVPLSNPFGLSVQGTNISMRTTHIGAGWVRTDLPAHRVQVRTGLYDFTFWKSMMARCKQANLEILAAITLPSSRPLWKMFLEKMFADNQILPIGAVIQPPTISPQPNQEYADQLTWIRDLLAIHAPQTKLIKYPVTSHEKVNSTSNTVQSITDATGFICADTPIPEECETMLETLGRRKQEQEQLWDLSVPAHIGGAPNIMADASNHRIVADEGTIQQLANPIDPVRSASRWVRSLLIRNLAGTQMACSQALALAPVRSIHHDRQQHLHEKDLSPRVALVAFDLMTSLLNDATIKRWIDIPDGCRLLYFTKDDGRAVVAAWRPFGLAPTRLGFTNLPNSIKVIDCIGFPEPVKTKDHQQIIEINEIVRYIIAPANQRQNLLKALDSARIVFDPPATQPAG
jgi:hypothetical protein